MYAAKKWQKFVDLWIWVNFYYVSNFESSLFPLTSLRFRESISHFYTHFILHTNRMSVFTSLEPEVQYILRVQNNVSY